MPYVKKEPLEGTNSDGQIHLPQIRRGSKTRLCNNAVLEIAGLKFVFLVNQELIDAIRQEAVKLYQNSV